MDPKLISAIIGASAGLVVAAVSQVMAFIISDRSRKLSWEREQRILHIDRQIDSCAKLLNVAMSVQRRSNQEKDSRKEWVSDFHDALSSIELVCPELLFRAAMAWAEDIYHEFLDKKTKDFDSWRRNKENFIAIAHRQFGVTGPLSKALPANWVDAEQDIVPNP